MQQATAAWSAWMVCAEVSKRRDKDGRSRRKPVWSVVLAWSGPLDVEAVGASPVGWQMCSRLKSP
jgi:hypothetical protein